MTEDDLARLLRAAYESAPAQDKGLFTVLFAIQFSDQLERHSMGKISELAGIGKWGPHLAPGRKLAKHVSIK